MFWLLQEEYCYDFYYNFKPNQKHTDQLTLLCFFHRHKPYNLIVPSTLFLPLSLSLYLIITRFEMTILCICYVSEHWSIVSGIICLPSPNMKITGLLARFRNQVTMVTGPLGDSVRGKRCRNRTKAVREWGQSIFVLFLESYLHLHRTGKMKPVALNLICFLSQSKLYILFYRLQFYI